MELLVILFLYKLYAHINILILIFIIIIITITVIIKETHYKMETIFMNTENSKTNEPHRFRLDLTDKLNLKNPNKNMALVNLSIYYTWKNIKTEYNNNKFKISAPIWNEMFFILLLIYNLILNLSSRNIKP